MAGLQLLLFNHFILLVKLMSGCWKDSTTSGPIVVDNAGAHGCKVGQHCTTPKLLYTLLGSNECRRVYKGVAGTVRWGSLVWMETLIPFSSSHIETANSDKDHAPDQHRAKHLHLYGRSLTSKLLHDTAPFTQNPAPISPPLQWELKNKNTLVFHYLLCVCVQLITGSSCHTFHFGIRSMVAEN